MSEDRLLIKADVLEMTTLTKSALQRYIKQGSFPKPIKLGTASRWSYLDVQAWIARKCKEANNSAA